MSYLPVWLLRQFPAANDQYALFCRTCFAFQRLVVKRFLSRNMPWKIIWDKRL